MDINNYLLEPSVTPTGKLILLYLTYHYEISLADLSAKLSINKKTVIYCVKNLISYNLVDIFKRGRYKYIKLIKNNLLKKESSSGNITLEEQKTTNLKVTILPLKNKKQSMIEQGTILLNNSNIITNNLETKMTNREFYEEWKEFVHIFNQGTYRVSEFNLLAYADFKELCEDPEIGPSTIIKGIKSQVYYWQKAREYGLKPINMTGIIRTLKERTFLLESPYKYDVDQINKKNLFRKHQQMKVKELISRPKDLSFAKNAIKAVITGGIH